MEDRGKNMEKSRVWDSVKDAGQTYCPAMLSNGALATLLGYHGDQQQVAYRNEVAYAEHACAASANFRPMHATFFRAGLRRGDRERNLLSLGHFEEEMDGVWLQPEHARQELNLQHGYTKCQNQYEKGREIITQAFIHKKESVFVLRKEFKGVSTYAFHYYYADENSRDQVHWSHFSARKCGDGQNVIAHWKTAGMHGDSTGTVVIGCSRPSRIEIKKNRVSFYLDNEPEGADFFLAFTDSFYEAEKEQAEAMRLRKKIKAAGFDGLLAEQKELWNAFWNTFELELPDKEVQETFETALYSLECCSTKWTLPVSINNGVWKGAYFAFNLFTEIFFATGHPQESFRIAAFRRKLLDEAYHRASGRKRLGARYPWICDEEGIWDVATPGIWTDHIFHMCNISEEVWNCYAYSQDKKLLGETCYPVLKGCADFFRYQSIYTVQDGRTIVGKCCDLERIGYSVQNAMLTTCGVIGTLEWAAAAARELQVDEADAKIWEELAALLRKSLPQDGEKYIPFENADVKSIGALGGFHPYPVISGKDPLAKAALDDFCADTSVGNMYQVGKGLCTWYADWVAMAMFRSGRVSEGIEYLHQAVDMTGAFRAVFEINEPGAFVSCPWCSAPNASFAQAVIQMLIWHENDVLHIANSFPEGWNKMHYTLRAPDDLTVCFDKKPGEKTAVQLTAGAEYNGKMRRICFGGDESDLVIRPGETLTFTLK